MSEGPVPLEEGDVGQAIQTNSDATVAIEGPVQGQEGEGKADYQRQDETSTTPTTAELTGETIASVHVGDL